MSSSNEEARPNPTTMEGMIWNTNHVLEDALKPNLNGMPKHLFEKCVGIVVINTVKVGFIFSGTVGGGLAFKKLESGKGWSPPCAVGISSLGFGIMAGMSVSDLVVFVFDEPTMHAFSSKNGVSLTTAVEVTVGPFGREGQLTDAFAIGENWKEKVGPTCTIAYSKGVFGGFQVEGAKIGTRDFVNNKYYSSATNGDDILFKPGSVTVPHYEMGLLPEIYDKLTKLEAGNTTSDDPPSSAELKKKATAKDEADKAGEAMKADPNADIVMAEG